MCVYIYIYCLVIGHNFRIKKMWNCFNSFQVSRIAPKEEKRSFEYSGVSLKPNIRVTGFWYVYWFTSISTLDIEYENP